MPILNRVSDMYDEIAFWRRHLHQHPEIGFEVHQTAEFVARRLEEFGVNEIHRGVGQTGVVAVIRGRHGDGPAIALRADMDALPIVEAGGQPHASTIEGAMHACGHDGHTAMLLGAAKYLAETRNFKGNVVLVFQPAEEIGSGARAMIEDGLFDRFGISHVYGMHNMPGIPVGDIALKRGAIMAASAKFTIRIHGRGGHAARPHTTIDPIVVGAQIVGALQTIVSRTVDPIAPAVVTVTRFAGGTADNIIPEAIELWGTARALSMADARHIEERVTAIATKTAEAAGARVEVDYNQSIPVTENDTDEAAFCTRIAREVVGDARVDAETVPVMAGEDFSHMLDRRPGTLVFLGNGASAGLHHPAYDFSDEAIPAGVSYWIRLVEGKLSP
ncbi:amidohydrolase [Aliihoeflea aestuarii]|uniref:M20 aminoacylase family protein n=1 Tax=Aliihoeflea aestuarii TaxID=453840 RepID=UPI002091E7E3|nr:M20 aminoacylase family protein [Aliihoeflea aestuarii]MCO6391275.1 amidohydrolase [Aliihoeflea aestuarii]